MAGSRRSTIARAHRLASRCVSIAIGMLVPGFLGYWLDGRLGSGPVLLLLGFAFGFTYGLWQLINLAKQREPSQPNNEQDAE